MLFEASQFTSGVSQDRSVVGRRAYRTPHVNLDESGAIQLALKYALGMTRQDVRVAATAAGVGLAIIVLIAGIGLIQRASMVTSGGGPPQDGDLISIPTAAPLVPDAEGNVCLLAGAEGRLVVHPSWGLAIQSGPNPPYPILWPHGYVGRIAGDRVELLDHRGRVVARSGDSIEMGGGQVTIEGVRGFGACPNSISVLAAQP